MDRIPLYYLLFLDKISINSITLEFLVSEQFSLKVIPKISNFIFFKLKLFNLHWRTILDEIILAYYR